MTGLKTIVVVTVPSTDLATWLQIHDGEERSSRFWGRQVLPNLGEVREQVRLQYLTEEGIVPADTSRITFQDAGWNDINTFGGAIVLKVPLKWELS